MNEALRAATQEVGKICAALQLLSVMFVQNERVLFHYNGHGVPRPTANGEIWVFNKSYTQYIPMSIYDLQVEIMTALFYALCHALNERLVRGQ